MTQPNIKNAFTLIRPHAKIIIEIALGLFFVMMGVFFLKHERSELSHVKESLAGADSTYILLGVATVFLFVLVQGLMYQESFTVIREQIKLKTGISLFLKRNLVSVFLPAGMLTNVFFFNKEVVEREGVSKTQIYYASWIFSICSILSSIIIGVPALIWLLLHGSITGQLVFGILLFLILTIVIVYLVTNLIRKGWIYRLAQVKMPSFSQVLDQLRDQTFDRRKLVRVILLSLIVEIIGIVQLCLSIKALGGDPSWTVAIIGYAIVLLMLMSSPFLRGIGAIEVLLTYSLAFFGYSTVMAISIAFLFRFFEFWLVLIFGVLALLSQRDNLVIRFLPTVLLFALGLTNILSAITPAIPSRLRLLREMLPLEAIQASTWFVFFIGILLLGIAIFLLRGLHNAWLAAVILSALSLFSHITKGIDWEEALLAGVTLGSLWYQRSEYFIKSDLSLARRSVLPGLIVMAFILIFGVSGFYFLDVHHFGQDFNLRESVYQSFNSFFFLNRNLLPATAFSRQFLMSMNVLGILSLMYTSFLIFRPFIFRSHAGHSEEIDTAKDLVSRFGKGSLDYFKTYYDKKFWFAGDLEGFIAFRTSRQFAIVLENPICVHPDHMSEMILNFDQFCRKNGLRTGYYRIPEGSKETYLKLGKKLFPIGEEAILNVTNWSLEGGEKKAIRNAVNKLTKQGFVIKINQAPQSEAFLQQLNAVSNSWLKDTKRDEIVFSQGLFLTAELRNQVILSMENPEGKVLAFVNLIPDYVQGEANFDLMRKTDDAPNGTMDYLFVGLFDYLKNQGYQTCNLGLAPMSGFDIPENFQERLIKLAYERIRRFEHYRSLRSYKEKFHPDWSPMYLAYDSSFDLIQLSGALEQVIQP